MYGSGSSFGGFRGNSSGGGGFRRGGSGGGFRKPFNRGPREMTKIKCSQCGKEDEVPFKPREGTSVLCKECYFKSKGIEPRTPFNKEEQKPKKESGEDSTEEETQDEASEEEF
jgi:DNA-directed RNA polymerase